MSKQKKSSPRTQAAKLREFTSADAEALLATAEACIKSHDYAQAKEVLQKIPGSYRDDDYQRLLERATELQKEVDFLIADMEQAVRLKEYEGLEANLKKLLKLKPGYKPARQLLEELNTYARGEMKRQEVGEERHYHREEGLLRPILTAVVGLAILAGAVYGGFILYLRTTAGTVKVTVYDPNVTVTLDDEQLTLTDDGVETTVRIGDHTLLVRQPGVSAAALEFAMGRGDSRVFHVELVDGDLVIDDGTAGQPATDEPAATIARTDTEPDEDDLPDPQRREATDEPVSDEPELVRTFTGHAENIMSVDFSPDGRYIATAGLDTAARIWDAETGEELHLLEAHTDIVHCVRFSPDGGRLLTAAGGQLENSVVKQGDDNTIRIWDVETGEELQRMEGHLNFVRVAAFSPNGNDIVSGGNDGMVKLWNSRTGSDLNWPVQPNVSIRDLAFSPDGESVVLGTQREDSLTMYDVTTGRMIDRFKDDPQFMGTLAIAPDGSYLVAAFSTETKLRLYDYASGEQVHELVGHSKAPLALSFSRDSQRIASTSIDGTVKIWEARTGQELHQIVIYPDGGMVTDVEFSPDGRSLLTTKLTEAVLYRLPGVAESTIPPPMARTNTPPAPPPGDLPEGVSLMQTLSGHSGTVLAVAYSPDGRYIATAGADATARLWNAETGEEVRRFYGHTDVVRCLDFSPDGARLVTGAGGTTVDDATDGGDYTARIWDVETGEELMLFNEHVGAVYTVRFAPTGRIVLSGCRTATARLWNAETGRELRWLGEPLSSVTDVAFTPDSRFAFIGVQWQEDPLDFCSVASGKEIERFKTPPGAIRCVALSTDGSRLAVGYLDPPQVYVYNVEGGDEIAVCDGHTAALTAVSLAPDGRHFLSSSTDGTVRLWQTETGSEVLQVPASQDVGPIHDVAFSPDGKQCVATAREFARIYQLADLLDDDSPQP